MTNLGPATGEAGAQALSDRHRAVTREHGGPVVQACDACQRTQFPPMLACRACGSLALSFVACASTGTVGTFVTVHTSDSTPSMSIPKRLRDQVPYSSVYVVPDSAPGLRLPALMLGPDQERLAVGASVTLEVTDHPALIAHLSG